MEEDKASSGIRKENCDILDIEESSLDKVNTSDGSEEMTSDDERSSAGVKSFIDDDCDWEDAGSNDDDSSMLEGIHSSDDECSTGYMAEKDFHWSSDFDEECMKYNNTWTPKLIEEETRVLYGIRWFVEDHEVMIESEEESK